MDVRIEIVEAVKDALQGRVGDDVINIVQDALTIELNRYEVQERCTEVAVPDQSAEGQLKKYLATKRIEGLAPKRLRGMPTKTGNSSGF